MLPTAIVVPVLLDGLVAGQVHATFAAAYGVELGGWSGSSAKGCALAVAAEQDDRGYYNHYQE